MAEGKRKQEWSQNAAVVAMIYNTNCKKEDQKKPAFFNPTLTEDQRMGKVRNHEAGMAALKMMLNNHLAKRGMET